jgi:hypothetical protein
MAAACSMCNRVTTRAKLYVSTTTGLVTRAQAALVEALRHQVLHLPQAPAPAQAEQST